LGTWKYGEGINHAFNISGWLLATGDGYSPYWGIAWLLKHIESMVDAFP